MLPQEAGVLEAVERVEPGQVQPIDVAVMKERLQPDTGLRFAPEEKLLKLSRVANRQSLGQSLAEGQRGCK